MEKEIYTPPELLSLDPEIQKKIAFELDVVSALNLCEGASLLNAQICKDEYFWRRKYEKDFGTKKVHETMSWFENYKLKATGFMDFEYDSDAAEIKVKIGTRTFIILSFVEPEDFETAIAFGSTPRDILEQIKSGTTYWISTDARLIKSGKKIIIEIYGQISGYNTDILLEDAEALRLIKSFYGTYKKLI